MPLPVWRGLLFWIAEDPRLLRMTGKAGEKTRVGRGKAPLVELRDVTVRAGGQTLLEHVDLRLERGEALRLAGPNGGGKTTLLRLLAGEIAPTSGERVYGLGGTVQRSAVRARRSLSVVGPDAETFYLTRDWTQTVRDVLLAGFEGDMLRLWEPTAEALARLREVAALTEVANLLERDFRTLSHGQRRRVVLARALMPDPELLLLDEFTDGLSAGARESLGHVLRDVHASGVALVLATHRPEEAPCCPGARCGWRAGRCGPGRQRLLPPPSPFPCLRPLGPAFWYTCGTWRSTATATARWGRFRGPGRRDSTGW